MRERAAPSAPFPEGAPYGRGKNRSVRLDIAGIGADDRPDRELRGGRIEPGVERDAHVQAAGRRGRRRAGRKGERAAVDHGGSALTVDVERHDMIEVTRV